VSAGELAAAGARARGLATHVLSRAALEELAAAPELASLARALGVATEAVTPEAVESALRHAAARDLRVLARWPGAAPVLDVFFADQDRRSVRAMLRGAMSGASEEARLAGLIATPRLLERALRLLARQPTVATVVSTLVVLDHAYGAHLAPLAARAHPVPFDLEVALLRAYSTTAAAAARAGDDNLRRAVRTRVDVCNAEMALALASGPRDAEPGAAFARGGEALSRTTFVEVAGAGERRDAATRLARALAGTPLAPLAGDGDPARVERDALALSVATQRRVALRDPLGSAPVLLFLLRLEAASEDVRRIAWAACLGAPGEQARARLVSPWR
jgi:vacuolar-type H+-ATPase subunit C/Vma6